jgi:hypothetical protein
VAKSGVNWQADVKKVLRPVPTGQNLSLARRTGMSVLRHEGHDVRVLRSCSGAWLWGFELRCGLGRFALLDFVPVNSQPLLAGANLLASTLICSLDVNTKRRRCSMENSSFFGLNFIDGWFEPRQSLRIKLRRSLFYRGLRGWARIRDLRFQI